MEHNERAHRCICRWAIGTGVNRQSLFVDGAWVNEIMMAKLLDEQA